MADLPGHAADSPSNDYLAPGRLRETPPGWAAMGHPTTRSHGCEVTGYQTLTPRPGATVIAEYADRAGPLAQAIGAHEVRVQVLDQASAANPGLAPQLGPRAPGGIAPQPAAHSAPNSPAPAEPRPVVPPAIEYRREGGQLQGPGR
jgi:hypothetical protein